MSLILSNAKRVTALTGTAGVPPAMSAKREQVFQNGRVADISPVEGAVQISRDDTRRRLVVSTNVRDRDIASFVHEANNESRMG